MHFGTADEVREQLSLVNDARRNSDRTVFGGFDFSRSIQEHMV